MDSHELTNNLTLLILPSLVTSEVNIYHFISLTIRFLPPGICLFKSVSVLKIEFS